MFLISAFSAVTLPRMLLGSIDFSRSPIRSRTKILGLAFGADGGSRKPGQRRWPSACRAPSEAVGIGMLALGLQRIFRSPKSGDVVVNFLLGRYLDELDPPFAPVPDRLCPQARALFETRFKVLIGEKILLPLHQAIAAGIEIGESADLQIRGLLSGRQSSSPRPL